MSISLQLRLTFDLIKYLSPNQSVLYIIIVFFCRKMSSLRMKLGDVLGYLLEGVNIYLPDVLDQLIDLINLTLINDELVSFL